MQTAIAEHDYETADVRARENLAVIPAWIEEEKRDPPGRRNSVTVGVSGWRRNQRRTIRRCCRPRFPCSSTFSTGNGRLLCS